VYSALQQLRCGLDVVVVDAFNEEGGSSRSRASNFGIYRRIPVSFGSNTGEIPVK
jgi:hypothetical protein